MKRLVAILRWCALAAAALGVIFGVRRATAPTTRAETPLPTPLPVGHHADPEAARVEAQAAAQAESAAAERARAAAEPSALARAEAANQLLAARRGRTPS